MEAATTERRRPAADVGHISAWLLTAVLVTMLVVTSRLLWWAPGGEADFNRRVTFGLFDVPLAMLIGLRATAIVRESQDNRRLPPVTIVFVAFVGWSIIAFAVSPSWRGLDWFFHVAGGIAVAHVLSRSNFRQTQQQLSVLVGVACLQGLIGVAQSLNGGVLGLGMFEYEGVLYSFGGRRAGVGSFDHPYHLTMFLLVAIGAAMVLWTSASPRWERLALGAVAVLGFAVPFTYSRASVVALVPVVLIGLLTSRHRLRIAAAVLAAGLVLGTVGTAAGWSEKVGRTADRERIDSSRLVRAEEALELIEEDPVFGVGPGLYVVELVDRGVDNGGSLPPHNAVLHSGAETGVVGAALSLVLFGALALWALSGGPLALIAAATLAPFHLLDSYPHVFPRGIVISGFWIGVLIVAHRRGLHGSLDASR